MGEPETKSASIVHNTTELTAMKQIPQILSILMWNNFIYSNKYSNLNGINLILYNFVEIINF